jgi:hypothetical protein
MKETDRKYWNSIPFITWVALVTPPRTKKLDFQPSQLTLNETGAKLTIGKLLPPLLSVLNKKKMGPEEFGDMI